MLLDGLRVIEITTYIAAPGAGAVLADWGADVIKVESPAGDPARYYLSAGPGPTENPAFSFDNRGKRGVVLDYGKPEGRNALLKLLENADVFLTNVRPGALKRAGLDEPALRARFPRLIYASVTGYGLEGPAADRPGFDIAAFWSRSGLAATTIPKGREPHPLRTGMGDHTCSLATVAAILAAVVERQRTGVGRLVETSLIRTGVFALASDLAVQLHYGKLASTKSRREALSPVSNFFRTADDRWVCIVPRQGEKDVRAICRAAGREDLLNDPRFQTGRGRREHAGEMVDALDAGFGALSFDEAAARLDAEDLVWDPVQRPVEVVADPLAEAAGCFIDMPDGQGGSVRAPAGPARFPGATTGPRRPPPELGEHTEPVLAEAGLSSAEIAALRAVGAVP